MTYNKENIVKEFDGGYNRNGYISVMTECCTVCSNKTKVVAINASEDEYNTGFICLPCTTKALKDE